MLTFNTEIGRIYCKYNAEKDNFDKLRIIGARGSQKKTYIAKIIGDDYRLDNNSDIIELSEEEYNDIKRDYDLLKSDGIVSLTNIVSVENEFRQIKDILLILFPNNKITNVPELQNPHVVARQGINDIFADMIGNSDKVGCSVSLETLPTGYTLTDFMENTSVISSILCHVYKTDIASDLDILLDNDESSDILTELFDQRVRYLQNTDLNFKYEEAEDQCIDGYCNSLYKFIIESGFMDDVYQTLGIIKVDFKAESGKALSLDDRLFIATLTGGIKIDKAVPLKFDYDIDMTSVKMKYFMILDNANELYIVPYTESSEEVDGEELYNLTEERTIQIQERLAKCVKAYDQSKNIKSDFADIMLN